jgi:hypothetical protein
MDAPRFFLLAWLGCTSAFSQSVTFGVKAGARLSGDLSSSGETISESKRYTLGPTVEFKLPLGLGLEVNALYKRVGTREFNTDILGDQFRSRDRSNSWEFPILVKYRLHGKAFRPYISGGYAIRAITGSGTVEGICCFSASPSAPTAVTRTVTAYSTQYNVSHGAVVGGGLELKGGPFRISPELRYTRWNNSALSMFPKPSGSPLGDFLALIGFPEVQQELVIARRTGDRARNDAHRVQAQCLRGCGHLVNRLLM